MLRFHLKRDQLKVHIQNILTVFIYLFLVNVLPILHTNFCMSGKDIRPINKLFFRQVFMTLVKKSFQTINLILKSFARITWMAK